LGEHHPALTPAAAQALAERVAAAMWARDDASQGLGMRILRVGPGRAELAMKVRADMLNGHAICHGGFITRSPWRCLRLQQLQSEHGRFWLRHRLHAPAQG
jgi:hypothetical protein